MQLPQQACFFFCVLCFEVGWQLPQRTRIASDNDRPHDPLLTRHLYQNHVLGEKTRQRTKLGNPHCKRKKYRILEKNDGGAKKSQKSTKNAKKTVMGTLYYTCTVPRCHTYPRNATSDTWSTCDGHQKRKYLYRYTSYDIKRDKNTSIGTYEIRPITKKNWG